MHLSNTTLCWLKTKQKLGDIMEMTFGGRYVILMISLFSIFTGLIYNEFFSVPFELFGPSAYACRDFSCRYIKSSIHVAKICAPCFSLFWSLNILTSIPLGCRDATTEGLIKVRSTYPFGVDPVWHGSRSELPFLNSLKMKMSILIGVAQMNLGIIISFFNAKFFGNGLNVW